jgi:hypothetical protein
MSLELTLLLAIEATGKYGLTGIKTAFSDQQKEVYDSGNIATATTSFGFIIPPTAGDYRIRIPFTTPTKLKQTQRN